MRSWRSSAAEAKVGAVRWRVGRALSILAAGGACACGLEANGLLEGPDAGRDGSLAGEGGAVDTGPSTGDAVRAIDARDEGETGAVDARTEASVDATVDAVADSP